MGLLLNMAELKCVFIAWLIHVTKKNFGLVLWTLYIVGVELFFCWTLFLFTRPLQISDLS